MSVEFFAKLQNFRANLRFGRIALSNGQSSVSRQDKDFVLLSKIIVNSILIYNRVVEF